MLPILQVRFDLSDAQCGSLFTAQFVGATLAMAASGMLQARLGVGPSLAAGFIVITLALLTLDQGSATTLRAALFGLGVGLGIAIPATNLWVAGQARGRDKAVVLNRLNLSWGLGAVACPVLVRFAVATAGHTSAFLRFHAVLGVVLALLSWRLLPSRPLSTAPGGDGARRAPVDFAFAAAFALFFFLYVGVETAVGGWVATYMKRGAEGGSWMWASALFWAGLLGGRFGVAGLFRRFDEKTILAGGSALALVATTILLVGPMDGVLAAACLAGVGLAPLYPTAAALFQARLGRLGLGGAGLVIAFGSVGGALLPWLVGTASVLFGELRLGLFVCVAACVGLLALSVRGLGGAPPEDGGAERPAGVVGL